MRESSRRDEILAVAATLMGAKGVAATSVREIGDAVGMLSGSLYHHFPSKRAIVEEIISGYIDDLAKSTAEVAGEPGSPPDQLRALIGASLRASARHPHAAEIYQNNIDYVRSLANHPHLQEVSRSIRSVWVEVIERGVAQGDFRADIDPGIFYRLLRGALWLSLRRAKPDDAATIEQLAQSTADVFLGGFAL